MACKYDENGKRITGKKAMLLETVVNQRVAQLLSGKKRAFNPKERTVIMHLLRANNNDCESTGKMVGIDPRTLRMWRKMSLTLEIDTMAKATIDQLVLRIAANHPEDGAIAIPDPVKSLERVDMGADKIIEDAITARRLAIDRIVVLIPQEKRIDNLLAVIKEMNSVIQSDSDLIKEGGGSILPALNRLANNANIDQEVLMAEIMEKMTTKNNFVQINNYQKVEDVEIQEEETKTEEDGKEVVI